MPRYKRTVRKNTPSSIDALLDQTERTLDRIQASQESDRPDRVVDRCFSDPELDDAYQAGAGLVDIVFDFLGI